VHMHPSRDCCRGGQCGQWSPRSNLTSTPLCSPTSEPTVEGKWSLEMPSFDTSVLSSPVRLLRKPVRLLRNPVISPVISAKTMKVVKKIVPPMRNLVVNTTWMQASSIVLMVNTWRFQFQSRSVALHMNRLMYVHRLMHFATSIVDNIGA